MKIKVTAASRRDEILKRQAEYDAKKAQRDAIYKEKSDKYRLDQDQVFASVENAIRDELGDNLGELNINVSSRFGGLIGVEISNGYGAPRKEPNISLTWSWSAILDEDGQVKKESNSWSGLEAVTIDQIEDLKRSVQQLEIINSMDWGNLLDVSLPNFRDYQVKDIEPIGPRPDFETELVEADLEEVIGKDILVRSDEGRSYRGDVYYRIIRDSGSQYTVEEFPAGYIDLLEQGETVTYGNKTISSIRSLVVNLRGYQPIRIRKSNFIKSLYKPLSMISF